MNGISLVLLTIFITAQLFGQTEFETYKSGLIYSETTMNKLERIVDSLNLKYKTCDLNKIFYSKSQTIAHIIRLDTNNIKQAKVDMESKISFEDFVLKDANATLHSEVAGTTAKMTPHSTPRGLQYGGRRTSEDGICVGLFIVALLLHF